MLIYMLIVTALFDTATAQGRALRSSMGAEQREAVRSSYTRAGGGVRCIPRTVYLEETKYEEGVDCHHTYKTKCHVTYTTEYSTKSEEKCETEFKRNCFINVKAVPQQEKVKICHTPIVKKCSENVKGPEVCTTEYENHCETHYKNFQFEQDEPNCKVEEEVRCQNVTVEILHLVDQFSPEELKDRPPHVIQEKCERWPVQKCKLERKTVTKIHPETSCKKVGREVCAPSDCVTVSGEEICREESRAQVQNVKGEECGIQPRRNCRNETKLVPRLAPKQICIQVPKEVCANIKKSPRRPIKKPVTKEWCFNQEDLNAKLS